jgi:hypothetical protein
MMFPVDGNTRWHYDMGVYIALSSCHVSDLFIKGGYGLHCAHFTFLAFRPPLILYSQISVNAAIVSDTGGTCVCPTDDMCNNDAIYLACVDEIRRELVTSTAAVSALASTLMGIFANLPVGLAPGLGLNAYVSAPRRCMISSLTYSSSPTLSLGIMAAAERPTERR